MAAERQQKLTDQNVTVLGTGAIGTAVARALLHSGRTVHVWNRTGERVRDSVAAGATSLDLQEAVAAGELLLVTVTDYRAAQEVLARYEGTLAGRTVVTLLSTTPAESVALAGQVQDLGGEYLGGGVQTAPQDIGTAGAVFLYSGAPAVYARHESTFSALGTARFAGRSPQAAAVWDLTLFGLWYDAQLGLLRALAQARDAQIDLAAFAATAATQLGHVAAAATTTAEEVETRTYPRGPADLREHLTVIDRLLDSRDDEVLGTGGLADARKRLTALIEEGRGAAGLTAVVHPG